jgi:hypothetical protein
MVLTLHHTLAPIGFRVEWAKKHISELEREVETFLASEPYEIASKLDNSGYYVADIRCDPPISISLIAGDVLFNLRAALDHLAYQLALANGTTDEKVLRGTSFPIFDSADLYGRYSRERMQGMSQDAIDSIDATKPYAGGNHLLWQLHKLNNIDKHRLLVTVGAAVGWHNLPLHINQSLIETLNDAHAKGSLSDWEDVMGPHTPAEIVNINVRPAFRKCPLEKGDELSLAWDDPSLHRNHDVKFTFEIAFSEQGIIQSQPVLQTLKEMANAIDLIIMSLKPLLPAVPEQ